MYSANRWIEGFAVNFLEGEMLGIWIIRRVNGVNVTFANIDDQSVVVKTKEDLEKGLAAEDILFLAEDRYNGEVVFQNLSEDDQVETARKYAYVKAYLESEDNKRSKKNLIILL